MSFAVLVLGAVGHVVLWVALVNRLHSLAMKRSLMNALTGLCLAGLFAIPPAIAANFVERSAAPRAMEIAVWAYLATCAVVLVVTSGRRLCAIRHPERRGATLANHTTRLNIRAGASERLAAPGIPTLLAALPGNQVFDPCLHEKQLAIPRLSSAHDGLRIAHIADLHMSGRIARAYYREVMDRVNECRPDLVAVTGDLVECDGCIDWIPDTLGRLLAPSGVYYVLGNHDRRVDQARLKSALAEAGLVHVGGRALPLTVRNAPVTLAGNELPWYGHSPPQLGWAGSISCPPPAAELRILLAHSPDLFVWAQKNGFDLMLAGHNHGGQVRLPLLGPILAPSRHGVRYASGTFRGGETILHVTRGAASLTPLRLNCPPEIALLILRQL